MCKKFKAKIMAGKSNSSNFVTHNQPSHAKKKTCNVNKTRTKDKNKNKNKIILQSSEGEISEKRLVHLNTEKKKEEENKIRKSKSLKQKNTFPQFIPKKEVNNLLENQNSSDTQYVEGYLHVNPRCYKYAYLSLSDEQSDLLIVGLRDRNRAFDGDFVVACINQPEKWHQGQKQKTGVIVCIKKKIHPRKAVGCFKLFGTSPFFYPRDNGVPLIKISKKSLQQFDVSASNYEDKLYLAVITNWLEPRFAIGKIEKIIGSIGDIKAELNAILIGYDLDVTPYGPDVTKGLPKGNYSLSENDTKDREDWRHECIFTIDPDTAVDLDDSVSCKLLENGNYEIGVHISDVTHYLEFLSPLDIQVSKRAITVYMTDNVYHMLPKQLCQVCSLLPGQDKLAFSVIWEMTKDAEVVKHRFTKTIIKSCCQMAYHHAQKFIENPENSWPDNFLSISGNFSISDLSIKVNILHNLAIQLRRKRFQSGAMQMNLPKLSFKIDKITGLPVSCYIEEQQDSNRLIEEFMLLANITVATHLHNMIPETALLRNHREPSMTILNVTKDTLQSFGIHLDIKSSASLYATIKCYEQETETENEEMKMIIKYRMMVINNLCSKAMARATYICSSTMTTEEELRHYGLNVPLYTHFTSPIRRYSDCIVHRLLYSTIKNVKLPNRWCKALCKSIAENCNVKKFSATMALEQSNELYFSYLVDLCGPIVTIGIVLSINENFIDVILCQFGTKLRINFTQLKDLALVEYSTECSISTIRISWKQPTVTQVKIKYIIAEPSIQTKVINVFSLLYLRLEKHPKFFQLIGNLLPPSQEIES